MAQPCTKEYWQGYRDCRTCFIDHGIKECEVTMEWLDKDSRYRAGWRRYIEYKQGRQIR